MNESPIKVPVFKGSHCVSIIACGTVHDLDEELLKWMEAEKTSVAALNRDSGNCFLKAGFGGKKSFHFHLEAVSDDYFSGRPQPNRIIDIEKFYTKITPFLGHKVTVDLTGMFRIDLTQLPDGGIVRALFFKTQKGSVSIKVTGAQFAINGTPVNSVIWQELPEDKMAIVIESENFETTIAEDYLTSAFDKLNAALNVFVLGKVPNEQK